MSERLDYTDFGLSKQGGFLAVGKLLSCLAMNTPTAIAEANSKYVWSVGIDRADQKHDITQHCLTDGRYQTFQIGADAVSVRAWLKELKELSGPQGRAVVGFEQSRGSLFEMLREQKDWLDLYPLNPLTPTRYRQTFYSSGAKDDPLDSQLIEELVCKHLNRLRLYQPPEPVLCELDLLCQLRRKAVDNAVRFENQLRSHLKVYYPLVLELHEELDSTLTLHFLKRWPTLQALKRAKVQTLRSFYYQHHSRSQTLIEERLQKIAGAQAVTEDRTLIGPLVLSVQGLVSQLLAQKATEAAFDKAIQELARKHPDYPIFESLPGAGLQIAPRLMVAFGSDRSALTDPSQMQKKSGIAPVLDRSSQSEKIRRRWCRPKFLCQTFHEFAGCSIPHCAWAKAYYQNLLSRGKSHNTAVRALAFKWIRIIFRLWQDHTLYDDERHLRNLTKRHSPLSSKI